MAARNPSQNPSPLYPEVILSNPEAVSASTPSSSSGLYPSVDMKDVAENLFPEDEAASQNSNPQSFEDVMIAIPGAIIHLIESENSVELASGVFSIVGLRQGDNVVAVLARIEEDIQWPLAKDEAAVRLDGSHYFFSLRAPGYVPLENEDKDVCIVDKESEMLNYGLTIASKGQEDLLKQLDQILENYSCFSAQKVEKAENWLVLDGSVPRELSPADLASEEKKELMEEISAAYWTTLAPNVDDYSGRVAKLIAAGSGQLVRGILWCGDVAVDQMKLGNELLKTRMGPCSNSEISPAIMKRMRRYRLLPNFSASISEITQAVKQLTKMSEKVAAGILSGVVKVSGFFTSSIVNSKVGKKFFSLMPGEIVLASMDGFNKICDAVEVAGKNVYSNTSVVTTGLVSQRFGMQAGSVTNEGFGAAGHAIGAAWAVFKIRKAINPKSVIKPTNLGRAAAREHSKAKNQK